MPSFENPDGTFFNESGGTPPVVKVPLTGDTITMKSSERSLYINAAGVLAALTVKLPMRPERGEFVEIGTAFGVTALTVQDGFGNAVSGAPTSLVPGASILMKYINSTIKYVVWAQNVPAVVQSAPADPTGTTSTTALMMGLAGAITPRRTGRVLVILSGDAKNTTSGDGVSVQLATGTGAAPANAAAAAGTAIGGAKKFVASANNQTAPFSAQAVVTGLAIGTAVWVDAIVGAITGGTASIENLSLTLIEL